MVRGAARGRHRRPRAIERGVLDVAVHDLRDFTTDRHRVVDDVPFGGGPGMVLKPEPLFARSTRFARERGAGGGDADVARWPAVHARGRGAVEPAGARRGAVRPLRRRGRAGAAGAGDRGAVDRRLRAVGRRAAGAGDRRRGRAAGAGRRRRRGIGGARYVRARVAGFSAVTRGRRSSRAWRCRRCCCRGTTPRCAVAARARRCARTLERRPDLLERTRRSTRRTRGCCSELLEPNGREGSSVMTAVETVEQRAARRAAGDQARRHRSRSREGARGRQGAHPGVRGHGHRDAPRRRARDVHRPQGVVRPGRRAHLPAALADHRQDRGGAHGEGAPRQAVLPARPEGQGRAHEGARSRRA